MPKRVIEYLRHHFKDYLKSSNFSIRSIATDLGMDYLRLYRFHSGELKGLTYFEARKISKFLQPQGWEKELAEGYPAETHDFLNSSDLPNSESSRAIESVVKSSQATEIFIFVTETPNACAVDVCQEFGNRGLQVLEELIKHEAVVREADGSLRSALASTSTYPDEALQSLHKNYNEITDREAPGHMVRLYSRGLNEAGLNRVYGIIAEATGALTDAFTNPDFSGNQIYLATLQCGLMKSRKSEIKS